jgi:AcrR family transcriptional regulator
MATDLTDVAECDALGRKLTIREQHRLLTRGRLIGAAHDVFVTKGYAAGKIDDIVAGAGTSRATFYLHFDAKVDVAQEIVDGLSGKLTALFGDLLSLRDVTRPAVHGWLVEAFIFHRQERRAFRVAQSTAGLEPSIARGWDGTTAALLETLKRVIDRAGYREDRAERGVRAAVMYGAFEQVQALALVEAPGPDVDVALQVLADAWCDQLGLPA